MELAAPLKRRLASGGTVVGSWLALGSTAVAEIMANAGYDFLTIDLEHSPTTLETTADLIRVIDLAGCSPLVRVTSNDADQIKRVLDAGAHGVIVPNVSTPQMAADAVAATRYAPAGVRGVGLHRAQGYGTQFVEYRRAAAEGILVAVQIESMQAVDNIDAILSVDGVDAAMIGPYDLSSDLGIPGDFSAPVFTSAVTKVLESAVSAGVTAGFHLVEPDRATFDSLAAFGYRFLVYSVDMRILDVGARLGAYRVGDER